MLEALWTVKFTSNVGGFGGGIVVLETSRVLGGDTQYTYIGNFRAGPNGAVNAEVEINEHTALPGATSVFGPLKHFHLKLAGVASPDWQTMKMTGKVVEHPQFSITVDFKRCAELPS